MAELAGVMVGNYFLLDCLAQEGMVETYLARPTTRGGYDVILRLFRPRFPDPTGFREHFAEEVEKVWRCRHSHIVPLVEFGTGARLLYCATQVPQGTETLEHLLARKRYLSLGQVLRLFTQLCAAVQYAHEQEVVHGNLQPANIYIRNGSEALLTGFSMQRATNDGDVVVAQLEGADPDYAAPEQYLGHLYVSSDIYALGVILYQMLSGTLPYAENGEEETGRYSNDPIPALRKLRPELPMAIENVLRGALANSHEARFQSVYALMQAVLAVFAPQRLQQGPPAPEPRRRIPVQSRRTRFTWSRAVSLFTMTILLGGLVGTSLFIFSLPKELQNVVQVIKRGPTGWDFSQVAAHVQATQDAGSGPAIPPVLATPIVQGAPGNTPVTGGGSGNGGKGNATATAVPPVSSTNVVPTAGVTPTTPAILPGVTPTDTPAVYPRNVPCVAGTLDVDGSAVQVPILRQAADDYHSACVNFAATIEGNGLERGVQHLQRGSVDMISSDLSVSDEWGLNDHPFSALLYAVIVHPQVRVETLSSAALLDIYQGRSTNWSQVGGSDQAIQVVRQEGVDRSLSAIFRAFVLDNQKQQVRGMRPDGRQLDDVLKKVKETPGAIGYVPLWLAWSGGVHILAINGAHPDVQSVLNGSYPFWSVEHFYTDGEGSAQAQVFMYFLGSAYEAGVLYRFGAVPIKALPETLLASHLPGPEFLQEERADCCSVANRA